MDYSYYSINDVPLVTYGMIAITTGILVTVSMSESGDNRQESESASIFSTENEQYGGRKNHHKKTKEHRKPGHRSSPKQRK